MLGRSLGQWAGRQGLLRAPILRQAFKQVSAITSCALLGGSFSSSGGSFSSSGPIKRMLTGSQLTVTVIAAEMIEGSSGSITTLKGQVQTALALSDRVLAKQAAEEEGASKRKLQSFFVLPKSNPVDVEKSFKDLASNQWVASVATNGDCTVILYNIGTVRTAGQLPPHLVKTLQDCKEVGGRDPVYISLGTFGRYYIKFSNGDSQWIGPKAMTKLLKDSDKKGVSSVSFGGSNDDYFVLFDDGHWESVGAPKNLVKTINANAEKPAFVSLGPKGEWFVDFKSSSVGTLSAKCRGVWKQLKAIDSVVFGIDDSFFLRGTAGENSSVFNMADDVK